MIIFKFSTFSLIKNLKAYYFGSSRRSLPLLPVQELVRLEGHKEQALEPGRKANIPVSHTSQPDCATAG